MIKNHPKYKLLQFRTESEVYRTDTSKLLAFDDESNRYLFRALNSTCFVQNDNNESIEILEMDKAEELWHELPIKNISNFYEAFPRFHGGTNKKSFCNNHWVHKETI